MYIKNKFSAYHQFITITAIAAFWVPTTGYSKTFQDVQDKLKSVQEKFQIPPATLEKWMEQYRAIESKLDFDTIHHAINSCSAEPKHLVKDCIQTITQLTYSVLTHLQIEGNRRFALDLRQTEFSKFWVTNYGRSDFISPENAEKGAKYLREAQNLGILGPVSSTFDIGTYALDFFVTPPSHPPKSIEDLSKDAYLMPVHHLVPIENGWSPKAIQKSQLDDFLPLLKQAENRFFFLKSRWKPEYYHLHKNKLSFSELAGNLKEDVSNFSKDPEHYFKDLSSYSKIAEGLESRKFDENYSGTIEIEGIATFFDHMGYSDPETLEVLKQLDLNTLRKLAHRFYVYTLFPDHDREHAEHFAEIKKLHDHLKSNGHANHAIPKEKIIQFITDADLPTVSKLNDTLSRITQIKAEPALELIQNTPLLTLSYLSNKNNNLLRSKPEQWLKETNQWITEHPESLNPKLNPSYFEILDGKWNLLETQLYTTLPHPLPDRKEWDSKFKSWLNEALSGDSAGKLEQLLSSVQTSWQPQQKGQLAALIKQFASPSTNLFLAAYLAKMDTYTEEQQVRNLQMAQSHLQFGSAHQLLQRNNATPAGVDQLIDAYQVEQIYKRIDPDHISSQEEKQLREEIKSAIIHEPLIAQAYEELAQTHPSSKLKPEWIHLSNKYPETFIPALLKHTNEAPEEVSHRIESNKKLRSITLSKSEKVNALIAQALAGNPQLLKEFENHLYKDTRPFPPDKKLYRWGEREYEKGRIHNPPFSLETGNFGAQADWPGLYLADSPLATATYGVGSKDPYLIEVSLPPDTHLLEPDHQLWNTFKEDPLIRELGVTESEFPLFLKFLNPKSFVIKEGSIYTYKTSRSGLAETYSKPKFTLKEMKNFGDVNHQVGSSLSETSKHKAAGTHFLKRVISDPSGSSCRTSPESPLNTTLQYDLGMLYHVQEKLPDSVYAIESRESINARHSFRCFIHEGKAIIATARNAQHAGGTIYRPIPSSHEIDYKTSADTCEEMAGTWNHGFVCEPDHKSGTGFRWVDLQEAFNYSFDRNTSPFFKSKEECVEAGQKKNLFWRCMPGAERDIEGISSKYTIQAEHLVSQRASGSALAHSNLGTFDSLHSCLNSLEQSSLGLTCIPNGHQFQLDSLFNSTHAPTNYPSLQECTARIESHMAPLKTLLSSVNSLQSTELLKKFEQIPIIHTLMAEPNTETGTLGHHSLAVLDHWDHEQSHNPEIQAALKEISSSTSIPENRLHALLRSTILLHDLGKPISHQHQHVTTTELLEPILDKMGFSPREKELGLSLIDHDLIGDFLKDGPTKGTQRSLKFQVNSMAKLLGIKPSAWFKIMVEFYTADASFYPSLRNQVFEESTDGSLKISDPLLNDLIQQFNR